MLESQLAPIIGDVTVTLLEPVGSPLPSNFIVDGTKPFDLKVEWTQSGDTWVLAPGGSWEVHILLEGLGATYEGELPAPPSPRMVAAVNTNNFTNTTTFNVPANSIPAAVYELAVMITYRKNGQPRALAGFQTIKPFQVYYHA